MLKRVLTGFIVIGSLSLLQAEEYLKLTWESYPQSGLSYFRVYRGTSPENLAVYDSVLHPLTEFVDEGVVTGQAYFYQLQAVNSSGLSSAPTEMVSGVIRPKPIVMQHESTYAMRLNWTTIVPARSQVVFGTTYPPDQYTELQPEYTTTHSVLLDFLDGRETYYLSCLAYDADDNVIATQDTTFSLNVAYTGDAYQVIAYPNPIRTRDHDVLYFDGLEAGSQVHLFNLAGELVWRSEPAAQSRMEWDVRNRAERSVVSGVYVYKITGHAGRATMGKVVVIR